MSYTSVPLDPPEEGVDTECLQSKLRRSFLARMGCSETRLQWSWEQVKKPVSWMRRFKFGAILLISLCLSLILNISTVMHYYVVDIRVDNSLRLPWHADDSLRAYFAPSLTPTDSEDMIRTLEALTGALEAANLTYFMYGGTLLGSYRHLGPIPWDDDTDILVEDSDRAKVLSVLKKLEPDYRMYTGFQWKFYLNDDTRPYEVWWERFSRWRWPFVDIFFYTENATHIWDCAEWNKYDYVWKKSDIFPLKRRPFSRLWLYGPVHAKEVLAANYKIDVCVSNSVNHLTEGRYSDVKTVNCSVLNRQYPLVHRTLLANGSMEEQLLLEGYPPFRTVIL